jgi:predicted nuclease of predicted toxin-antitoxin system
MRVLLDESLPRKLASELTGHVTQTVQKRGWSGLKNGELLRTASAEFEVLLTGDQNLSSSKMPPRCQSRLSCSLLSTIVLKHYAPLFPNYSKRSKAFVPDNLYE